MNRAKKALIRSIRLTLSTLSCLDGSKPSLSPPPTRIHVSALDLDAVSRTNRCRRSRDVIITHFLRPLEPPARPPPPNHTWRNVNFIYRDVSPLWCNKVLAFSYLLRTLVRQISGRCRENWVKWQTIFQKAATPESTDTPNSKDKQREKVTPAIESDISTETEPPKRNHRLVPESYDSHNVEITDVSADC